MACLFAPALPLAGLALMASQFALAEPCDTVHPPPFYPPDPVSQVWDRTVWSDAGTEGALPLTSANCPAGIRR